jgi:uncharacterized protein (DUF1501 family)
VGCTIDRLDDFAIGRAPDQRKGLRGSTADAPNDLTAFVSRTMLDAYTTAEALSHASPNQAGAGYPTSELAGHLQMISSLIKAGFAARVYYTIQSGYDTHSLQLGTHARLLSQFATSLKAFLDDLSAARLADRVLVLAFSEFGRTVAENASGGTDHGTSGPVFLAGPSVRTGLFGATASLLDLDPKAGDLRTCVDFRRIYSTVVQNWLRLQAETVLGGTFEPLPLLKI